MERRETRCMHAAELTPPSRNTRLSEARKEYLLKGLRVAGAVLMVLSAFGPLVSDK